MITTNIEKKALAEKLLKEDKITMDEMLMLLEETTLTEETKRITDQYPFWPIAPPITPVYPVGGWWEWHPYQPWRTVIYGGGTGNLTVPTNQNTSISYDMNDSITNSKYKITCN